MRILSSTLTLTLLLGACGSMDSTPQASDVQVTDSEIAANVGLAYHDKSLAGWEKIKIDVKDGVVTLEGSLASEEAVENAVKLAETVDGVARVDSNLSVAPGDG